MDRSELDRIKFDTVPVFIDAQKRQAMLSCKRYSDIKLKFLIKIVLAEHNST